MRPKSRKKLLREARAVSLDVLDPENYVNVKTELTYRCQYCGRVFKRAPINVQTGHGCACDESYRAHVEGNVAEYGEIANDPTFVALKMSNWGKYKETGDVEEVARWINDRVAGKPTHVPSVGLNSAARAKRAIGAEFRQPDVMDWFNHVDEKITRVEMTDDDRALVKKLAKMYEGKNPASVAGALFYLLAPTVKRWEVKDVTKVSGVTLSKRLRRVKELLKSLGMEFGRLSRPVKERARLLLMGGKTIEDTPE